MSGESCSFEVSPELGSVSALWRDPPRADRVLVLAHGAGADMHHSFMEDLSSSLASLGIATLRYQFPYTEVGHRAPNRPPALIATVRAALAEGAARAGRRPLFAGGKSLGGRMTSRAVAERAEGRLTGLIYVGFPLHPSGKPGTERADHLDSVPLPQLFLQGDRDKLADLSLLHLVLKRIGKRATLHTLEAADHGFHVLKRSGRNDAEVLNELAAVVNSWTAAEAKEHKP